MKENRITNLPAGAVNVMAAKGCVMRADNHETEEVYLPTLIQTAFANAKKEGTKDHKKRSSAFVEQLAKEFMNHFPTSTGGAVFCRSLDHNKREFLLNELLYDIHVCLTDTFWAMDDAPHKFVTRSLWQVESEFSKNSRQVAKDFQKLVAGSAQSKLMIGPLFQWQESLRTNDKYSLREIARSCAGKVFFALVPHPEDWPTSDAVECFKFTEGKWQLT